MSRVLLGSEPCINRWVFIHEHQREVIIDGLSSRDLAYLPRNSTPLWEVLDQNFVNITYPVGRYAPHDSTFRPR